MKPPGKKLSTFQAVLNVLYRCFHVFIACDHVADLIAGIHDGGMVSSAEDLTDGDERKIKHFANKIYGHHTRFHYFFVFLLSDYIGRRNMKIFAYGRNDLIAVDLLYRVFRMFFQRFFSNANRNRIILKMNVIR